MGGKGAIVNSRGGQGDPVPALLYHSMGFNEISRMDWTLILGQDWLMTHADPSIRFSFHSSYTSLGAL